jgi:hypothetical protein
MSSSRGSKTHRVLERRRQRRQQYHEICFAEEETRGADRIQLCGVGSRGRGVQGEAEADSRWLVERLGGVCAFVSVYPRLPSLFVDGKTVLSPCFDSTGALGATADAHSMH